MHSKTNFWIFCLKAVELRQRKNPSCTEVEEKTLKENNDKDKQPKRSLKCELHYFSVSVSIPYIYICFWGIKFRNIFLSRMDKKSLFWKNIWTKIYHIFIPLCTQACRKWSVFKTKSSYEVMNLYFTVNTEWFLTFWANKFSKQIHQKAPQKRKDHMPCLWQPCRNGVPALLC